MNILSKLWLHIKTHSPVMCMYNVNLIKENLIINTCVHTKTMLENLFTGLVDKWEVSLPGKYINLHLKSQNYYTSTTIPQPFTIHQ